MALELHQQSFLSVELTFSWSNLLRKPGALPEETGAGQHMVWITFSIPEHFLLRRLLGKCWTQTSLYMRKATPLTERDGGRKSDTTCYTAFVKKCMHKEFITVYSKQRAQLLLVNFNLIFLRDLQLITNSFIYLPNDKETHLLLKFRLKGILSKDVEAEPPVAEQNCWFQHNQRLLQPVPTCHHCQMHALQGWGLLGMFLLPRLPENSEIGIQKLLR